MKFEGAGGGGWSPGVGSLLYMSHTCMLSMYNAN